MNAKGIRRSGRTTRLADRAIQDLFDKGSVKCEDHTQERRGNKDLYNWVLERLKVEHPHIFETLNFDHRQNLITFYEVLGR